jgi:hypothetical protein
MTKLFQELGQQAEAIFQQVEAKDQSALQASCLSLKESLLEHVDAVKKLIATWVQNKQRAKAKALRYEVKDARVAVERSIRSRYLSTQTELASPREDLILVAKKLIKIEKALSFADDMLFAGEIQSGLEDVIHQAKSIATESEAAALAMQQVAKVRQLDHNHDNDLRSSHRM